MTKGEETISSSSSIRSLMRTPAVWIVVAASYYNCSLRNVHLLVRAFSPSATNNAAVPRFVRHISWQPLRFSEAEENSSADNNTASAEDWRDFRARLIQQFKQPSKAEDNATTTLSPISLEATNHSTTTSTRTTWAYDSGGAIECGSLIVSHPVQDFACGGLRQQYFTKCVVLVVRDDASFTKGVILNRNCLTYEAPSATDGGSTKFLNWTIYYGGDVQGIDSPETDFTCLHRLKSPFVNEFSFPVVKDIQHTTWEMAKLLVERGEATPDDFITFAGYVGWAPHRLQEELERGNWFMVASDSHSISELLFNTVLRRGLGADSEDVTGMDTWKHWMERIGKDHLVNDYAKTQTFEDAMLKKWIDDKLSSSSAGRRINDSSQNGLIIDPPSKDEHAVPQIVEAGIMFRSIRPIILDEQVFHRSLIIILKKDERGYIGVILNRPSSRVTTLNTEHGGEELVVRYGGRYGLGDEGTPETWLHHGNMELQNARVGSPLIESDEQSIWQCTRQDAETAVEMGLAPPSAFLVTWGLTLWETNPPPRGLGRPLTTTSLNDEFKPVFKSAIPNLWKELMNQKRLTEETFEMNLEHASAAYEMAKSPFVQPNFSRRVTVNNEDMAVENNLDFLAEDALRRWIRMFIMNGSTAENGQ